MELGTNRYEERVVVDITARYDHTALDVTLQEGDSFEEHDDFWYACFKNPNGLSSDIRIYKTGLRAISTHRRIQRYLVDLPVVTAQAAQGGLRHGEVPTAQTDAPSPDLESPSGT